VSPFYGPVYPMDEYDRPEYGLAGPLSALGWIVAYSALAAFLFWATLATFDRCMGRARGRPSGSAPRPAKGLHGLKGRRFFGSPPKIARHAFEE
jgi:hypothetical protein